MTLDIRRSTKPAPMDVDTLSLNDLPPEMLCSIFSYLPLKDMIAASKSCKYLNSFFKQNSNHLITLSIHQVAYRLFSEKQEVRLAMRTIQVQIFEADPKKGEIVKSKPKNNFLTRMKELFKYHFNSSKDKKESVKKMVLTLQTSEIDFCFKELGKITDTSSNSDMIEPLISSLGVTATRSFIESIDEEKNPLLASLANTCCLYYQKTKEKYYLTQAKEIASSCTPEYEMREKILKTIEDLESASQAVQSFVQAMQSNNSLVEKLQQLSLNPTRITH